MKKSDLAHLLRQRQYARKLVNDELIASMSDDQMINSYITCSCCGKKEVDQDQLAICIEKAYDDNSFFDRLDELNPNCQC